MITLMAGNIVGLIATMIIKDYGIDAIVAYDNKELYKELGFNVYDSIKDVKTCSSILLSVHGREIVPDEILKNYIYCVNIHPFLNRYKGKNPVKRTLKDKNHLADVSSHYMTSKVDEGRILFQETMEVKGTTEQEIYTELYPLYARVIKSTLEYLITKDKMNFNLTY